MLGFWGPNFSLHKVVGDNVTMYIDSLEFFNLKHEKCIIFHCLNGVARSWFQIFLEISTLFGEDSHFDEHNFSRVLSCCWDGSKHDVSSRLGAVS